MGVQMHKPHLGIWLVAGALTGTVPAVQAGDIRQLTTADYQRAERFLPAHQGEYLLNGQLQHRWLKGQDRFWYRRSSAPGVTEFVLVDAASGKRSPAFDQVRVAAGLSKVFGKVVTAGALPFTSFRYAQQGQAIEFLAHDESGADQLWTCQTRREECVGSAAPAQADPGLVVSPDGKWAAFVKDYNLWVRALDGGGEFALTTDGIEHYGYAGSTGTSTHAVSARRSGKPIPPVVLWSPDSTKLLTHRIDERLVKELSPE